MATIDPKKWEGNRVASKPMLWAWLEDWHVDNIAGWKDEVWVVTNDAARNGVEALWAEWT